MMRGVDMGEDRVFVVGEGCLSGGGMFEWARKFWMGEEFLSGRGMSERERKSGEVELVAPRVLLGTHRVRGGAWW